MAGALAAAACSPLRCGTGGATRGPATGRGFCTTRCQRKVRFDCQCRTSRVGGARGADRDPVWQGKREACACRVGKIAQGRWVVRHGSIKVASACVGVRVAGCLCWGVPELLGVHDLATLEETRRNLSRILSRSSFLATRCRMEAHTLEERAISLDTSCRYVEGWGRGRGVLVEGLEGSY